MSNYAPGGPKFGKVCKHAILERSCDECHDTLGTKAQLTTLIREAAAWRAHKSINPISLIDAPISRAIRATNAHPDLQARIAREMEKK